MKTAKHILILTVSALSLGCTAEKASGELDKAIANKSHYNALKEQRLQEFKTIRESLGGGGYRIGICHKWKDCGRIQQIQA